MNKKYHCPQCNELMVLANYDLYYKCKLCCIKYYLISVNDAHPIVKSLDNTFWVNDDLLCEGTFEECCKFYKLKVFL